MDIYSKRRAGSIAAIRIPKKGLTDFQEDAGRTVEGRLRGGADLEADDCGNRFVCASEALGLEQRAATTERSGPEMLDDLLRASQMRSGEENVRAQATTTQSEACAGDGNRAQRQQARGGSMVRVVISKQQLSKLLAEGSIKKSASCKALLPPSALQSNGQCNMAMLISNAMTMTRSPGSPWSPRLDTIVEAPVQLTRSPVITRNCKEVEHLLQTKM